MNQKKKLLFVCHGNICRSTMAEFVMKDLAKKAHVADQLEIASAATSREEIGNDTHPGTKRKLDEMHIPYTRRKARQLTKADYEQYDLLFGMDSANISNMRRICGGDPDGKIHRLLDDTAHPRDIADPWYTGNFDETYEDVLEGCEALLQRLF